MNPWLAIQVGCLECGEDTMPLGLFATKEEGEAILRSARQEHEKDWHGSRSFEMFDLSEFIR